MKHILVLILAAVSLPLNSGCSRGSVAAKSDTKSVATDAAVVEVRTPPAVIQAPVMADPVDAAPKAVKPSASGSVKKPCDCETAETDLPELCPNESCRACKASCGIPGH